MPYPAVWVTVSKHKNKENAFLLIKNNLAPNLVPLNYDEFSYATDCSIYNAGSENPYGQLWKAMDMFVVAHGVGWVIHMLVCRNFVMALLLSATFQLVEYSLRNVLNNFKECWWDSLILDFMGFNLMGIVIGAFVIDKLNLARYQWSLRLTAYRKSLWDNIVAYATTWHLKEVEVRSIVSLKSLLGVLFFIVMQHTVVLAVFFLKFIYGIPSSNSLVIGRTVLVSLLALLSCRQHYNWLQGYSPGPYLALLLLIIAAEIMLVIKHGDFMFQRGKLGTSELMVVGVVGLLGFTMVIKAAIADFILWRKSVAESLKGMPIPQQEDNQDFTGNKTPYSSFQKSKNLS